MAHENAGTIENKGIEGILGILPGAELRPGRSSSVPKLTSDPPSKVGEGVRSLDPGGPNRGRDSATLARYNENSLSSPESSTEGS